MDSQFSCKISGPNLDGLYIFHATMILLALRLSRGVESHPALYSTISPTLALALTIGAAAVSYLWFEQLFLKLKTRFQYVRSIPV